MPRHIRSARASLDTCCPDRRVSTLIMQLASPGLRGWPDSQIHVERFSGEAVETSGTFQIMAQKSGVTINVAEGQTALQTALDAGLDVPFACESGICGTCACPLLAGAADHRDRFQTGADKAANKAFALCCSRAPDGAITLDI